MGSKDGNEAQPLDQFDQDIIQHLIVVTCGNRAGREDPINKKELNDAAKEGLNSLEGAFSLYLGSLGINQSVIKAEECEEQATYFYQNFKKHAPKNHAATMSKITPDEEKWGNAITDTYINTYGKGCEFNINTNYDYPDFKNIRFLVEGFASEKKGKYGQFTPRETIYRDAAIYYREQKKACGEQFFAYSDEEKALKAWSEAGARAIVDGYIVAFNKSTFLVNSDYLSQHSFGQNGKVFDFQFVIQAFAETRKNMLDQATERGIIEKAARDFLLQRDAEGKLKIYGQKIKEIYEDIKKAQRVNDNPVIERGMPPKVGDSVPRTVYDPTYAVMPPEMGQRRVVVPSPQVFGEIAAAGEKEGSDEEPTTPKSGGLRSSSSEGGSPVDASPAVKPSELRQERSPTKKKKKKEKETWGQWFDRKFVKKIEAISEQVLPPFVVRVLSPKNTPVTSPVTSPVLGVVADDASKSSGKESSSEPSDSDSGKPAKSEEDKRSELLGDGGDSVRGEREPVVVSKGGDGKPDHPMAESVDTDKRRGKGKSAEEPTSIQSQPGRREIPRKTDPYAGQFGLQQLAFEGARDGVEPSEVGRNRERRDRRTKIREEYGDRPDGSEVSVPLGAGITGDGGFYSAVDATGPAPDTTSEASKKLRGKVDSVVDGDETASASEQAITDGDMVFPSQTDMTTSYGEEGQIFVGESITGDNIALRFPKQGENNEPFDTGDKSVFELLVKNINNEQIRLCLVHEMRAAFLANELPTSLKSKAEYKRHWDNMQREPQKEEDIRSLDKWLMTKEITQQYINDYLRVGGWLKYREDFVTTPSSMYAVARLTEVKLSFWELEDQTNQLYFQYSNVGDPDSRVKFAEKSVHLVHCPGEKYFRVMLENDAPQNQAVPVKVFASDSSKTGGSEGGSDYADSVVPSRRPRSFNRFFELRSNDSGSDVAPSTVASTMNPYKREDLTYRAPYDPFNPS